METTVLFVLQVISAVMLIGLILVQQGKGADAGAAFGGGAQTVFGSSGSGNFLTRTTAILATIFFCASLGLAYVGKQSVSPDAGLFAIPELETISVDEDLPAVTESSLLEDQDLPEVVAPAQETMESISDSIESSVDDAASAIEQPIDAAKATATEAAAEVVDQLESVIDSSSN